MRDPTCEPARSLNRYLMGELGPVDWFEIIEITGREPRHRRAQKGHEEHQDQGHRHVSGDTGWTNDYGELNLAVFRSCMW